MMAFALILSVILLMLLIMMGILALRFISFYMRDVEQSPPKLFPKVGIILPLRGSDPFLKRCLTALVNQQYPDYVIQVVVDNPLDPARAVVESLIREYPNSKMKVDFLNDFTDTCSLRNCALRQAYKLLPEECEVIILVDADAYPFPGWIEELVSGLEHPDVGVACGIRWFSPVNHTMNNIIRHIWNAGAFLQMYQLNIGWGGAFAMKKSAFIKADIYNQWGKALFDDTFATDLILKQGMKLKILPRVTMMNEEDTDLKGCVTFITRQLLNIRLYHRSWPVVSTYGLAAFIITLTSIFFIPQAFLTGHKLEGTIVLISLIIYYLSHSIYLWIGDMTINTAQRAQNKPGLRFSPWYLPFAMLAALLVYPYCILKALNTRQVTWRGITYKFSGPDKIKRINYEPYVPVSNSTTGSL